MLYSLNKGECVSRIAEAFESLFSALPSLVGQKMSKSNSTEKVSDIYKKSKDNFHLIGKSLAKIYSLRARGFAEATTSETQTTNGPIAINYQNAAPVHSHAPWITIHYNPMIQENSSDVYPVVLFDSKIYSDSGTDRIWLGFGMGVDEATSKEGQKDQHQLLLDSFKMASEDKLADWEFGAPKERGHDRLNNFLDCFICWKRYEVESFSEKIFLQDVEDLMSTYVEFLLEGAFEAVQSNQLFQDHPTLDKKSRWFWSIDDAEVDWKNAFLKCKMDEVFLGTDEEWVKESNLITTFAEQQGLSLTKNNLKSTKTHFNKRGRKLFHENKESDETFIKLKDNWRGGVRITHQIFQFLLLESWLRKTESNDFEFEEGMGYTSHESRPKYKVLKPKPTTKTPSFWKIYINSGSKLDKGIKFNEITQIAVECAINGTYHSKHSANSDRVGIKVLAAILPQLFVFESANTIRFLGASSSPPPLPPPTKPVKKMMTEEEKRLVDLLSVTKNVVLDGVPGTGKTYIAKRISKLVGDNTRGHCTGKFAITLHPSTSYEDFVEGLRPNQDRVESGNAKPIRVLLDHPSDHDLKTLMTLDPSGEASWSDCTVEEGEDDATPIIEPVPTSVGDADSQSTPSLPEITDTPTTGGTSIPRQSPETSPPDRSFFFQTSKQIQNAQFSIEDGFFLRVCKEALQYPDEEVYILIDEINRGNVPKVLGDLLSTMEDSKRIPSMKAEYQGEIIDVWRLDLDNLTITLPYSKRVFFVPENIKIIATRNTTDRSVVPLDAALRRRFSFFRLEPNRPEGMGGLETYLDTIFDESTGLNAHLEKNIGPDAMIGHSYFYDMEKSSSPELIWRYSVLTQLVDVLDAANYVDKVKIEKINEILQPTEYFFESTGENLHQKLRIKETPRGRLS